jgi:hypothetical protein
MLYLSNFAATLTIARNVEEKEFYHFHNNSVIFPHNFNSIFVLVSLPNYPQFKYFLSSFCHFKSLDTNAAYLAFGEWNV